MKVRVKKGVKPDNLEGIHPAVVFALGFLDSILADVGMSLTITSLMDGKHGEGSLHYKGCAADVRRRDMGKRAKEIASFLREGLDSSFDVVLESTHIHIEYDPKGGESWLEAGVA